MMKLIYSLAAAACLLSAPPALAQNTTGTGSGMPHQPGDIHRPPSYFDYLEGRPPSTVIDGYGSSGLESRGAAAPVIIVPDNRSSVAPGSRVVVVPNPGYSSNPGYAPR